MLSHSVAYDFRDCTGTRDPLSHWLNGLNPEQAQAARHNYGPLLILAGAGSGKTTVLVARAGRLIEEGIVPAQKLCVLTFTNKAARELKSRVGGRLGKAAKGLWAGTFHSFGLSVLRRFHAEAGLSREFGVLDAGDANAIVKEILRDFHQNGKTAYDGEKILSLISEWREEGRTQARRDDEYENAVEWLLPRYLKRLQLLGMVDFDSLILGPIELMQKSDSVREALQDSFGQVMVDEFQDTNAAQMRFIQLLVASHGNLAVVGDDDQSIYGWRGACVANILGFPKRYPGCQVVRLERNYRSTPAILEVANAVIGQNTVRHRKVLRSDPHAERGELPEVCVYENENEEAEHVAGEIAELIRGGQTRRSIAVLYRSNSQGALLEAELRKSSIPYLMSGGTAFFDRKETRDVLAYLRCAFQPNEVALRRILNTPARGIGERTVELVSAHAVSARLAFPAAVRAWRQAGVEERAGAAIEALLQTLAELIPELIDPNGGSAGEKLLKFFERLGYRQHIEKHTGNALIATKRWRVLEIFAGILDRFMETGGRTAVSLREFLDAMELRDAIQTRKEDEDRVQLMTLHSCKGLEFPTVFLMGIEEDIIPHKVLGSDVSEERRLFYVGVTRAQKRLVLSRAERRKKYGKWVESAPSRFLLEIPPSLVQSRRGPKPIGEQRRRSMVE
jgi:DNA helicase-2/ATP-dependent DNA helicase PcrA